MWRRYLQRLTPYGVAVATSTLATLLSLALWPLIVLNPSIPFLAAVALSAWYGGLGPGLLATALGALASTYFQLSPAFWLDVDPGMAAASLGGFVLVGVLIAALSARLRATQQQAERAVRARDEVLAAVSHDLKNPLAAIKGQAQLLRMRVATLHGPERDQIAEGLARLDASATKMVALINELLDVAHLQGGRSLPLDRRPVDLVELARQAVAEWQQIARRHNLRLEARVPELIGQWDDFRLGRVLDNLISNAVKYSPNGGEVVVTVDRDGRTDDGWAILRVQDQGIGIPAADLPRIFERFERARNVAGQARGTGIGLAGARAIVTQHGGTIQAASQEGVGSTFTVRLPVAPPEHASEVADPPPRRRVSA